MWYNEVSKDSDVVISTRIRYARNIEGFKFAHILSDADKEKLLEQVKVSVDSSQYDFFRLADIDEINLNSLIEKHVISKELLNESKSALVTNKTNEISMMILEEDHLRIQAFKSGFNIDICYNDLINFTNELNKKIKFSYNDKYGYLSACHTNVGTGMRVSVMLHLPALARLGLLEELFEQANSIGMTIRGVYGENSDFKSNMYQISNRKTLGLKESEILKNMQISITSIIEQERKARQVLKKNSVYLEDEIYRAYGILKYAKIITAEEAVDILAKLRLGVTLGILNEINLEKIQSLMINIEPFTLRTILKENFAKKDENIKRSEYIRKELI